ncbi:MAG TPA: hypothetical protein VFQ45_11095, partial [Longimicrobium sp.]|nr:hypothetical protein [Longimicrobium sp.]
VPGDADVYVVLATPAAQAGAALASRARAGATVVLAAGAVPGAMLTALPWRGSVAAEQGGAGTMWLGPETELAGAPARATGTPAKGARVIASWQDGRPAATAVRHERGCVVFVGAELETGELPLSGAYPAALDRLARGCEPSADPAGDAPLDAGARAVLRGMGPAAVAAGALGGAGQGTPLGRWVLAAALVVALLETFLAYRRRTA